MTHMVQPMALLGGWWGGHLLQRIDWQKHRAVHGWVMLALVPALLYTLATLLGSLPEGGQDLDVVARRVSIIPLAGISVGLLYLATLAFIRYNWKQVLRLAIRGNCRASIPTDDTLFLSVHLCELRYGDRVSGLRPCVAGR